MRQSITQHSGFTLIEMLLALSIFSLMLLFTYQTIVSSADAKRRVSESVGQQSELRSAYRTLSNAFASKAIFIGDKSSIDFDLSSADSAWLEGADRLSLVFSKDQSLLAFVDDEAQASRLLSSINQAQFGYIHGGLRYRQWDKTQRPDLVVLSWNEQGELQRWQFDTR